MTAEFIALGLRARRSDRGWTARCPAHEDHSPSLSIAEKDGRVLVHCHAGCEQAAVIDALRARGLWPETERRVWTPADRARWAREQRDLERDLPTACYWRRAAVTLGEQILVNLKAALFDPTLPRPEIGELADMTRQVARWQRMGGAELVAEYRSWRDREPTFTAGMVHAARLRERAEVCALLRYLEAAA